MLNDHFSPIPWSDIIENIHCSIGYKRYKIVCNIAHVVLFNYDQQIRNYEICETLNVELLLPIAGSQHSGSATWPECLMRDWRDESCWIHPRESDQRPTNDQTTRWRDHISYLAWARVQLRTVEGTLTCCLLSRFLNWFYELRSFQTNFQQSIFQKIKKLVCSRWPTFSQEKFSLRLSSMRKFHLDAIKHHR